MVFATFFADFFLFVFITFAAVGRVIVSAIEVGPKGGGVIWGWNPNLTVSLSQYLQISFTRWCRRPGFYVEKTIGGTCTIALEGGEKDGACLSHPFHAVTF